jgi:predicted alpha-1,2-mannosidase
MRNLWMALAAAWLAGGPAAADNPVSSVDPFLGTGAHGHTYPGPALPFGMVQVGPDTRLSGWDGSSGYHDSDRTVYGFSHTHLSGTGIADYNDVLLLPATGDVVLHNSYEREDGQGYGSAFRKENERAEAGYYAVDLDRYHTRAELTATRRAGMHRYTFPRSEAAYILLDLQHRDPVLDSSLRVVGPTEIEGMRRSRSWAQDQRLYFVARFSRPFDAEIAVDDVLRPDLREAVGRNLKVVLRYHTRDGEAVLVKVGLSAVDVEGARRNLDAEVPGWDFDGTREAARKEWRAALGRVDVKGGSDAQRQVFYTALYHAMLAPNLYMDVDGRYRGTDGQVHRGEGFEYYTVFSLWDTFRAQHPLLVLLEPRRTRDFIETFLRQHEQGGHLPVWELSANETWCMIGYHAVSVIADAFLKDIRGFDAGQALDAMVAAADSDRYGLTQYRRQGYIPHESEGESVSKTLEYAYDDWAIARMAQALGRDDVYRRFLRRAQSYKNVLDPETGFMRGRGYGRWHAPFDPFEVNFHFTEANAWQYSFFVPHDVSGLMAAWGGAEKLAERLDALFAASSQTTGRQQNDISGLIGQYAHGNEPSHHMAYLYNYAGQPWKTQQMVRRILTERYGTGPEGLAGNEDCGQMSAWYVLSALGFYPVTPGSLDYALASPLFEEAVLHLPGGRRFAIEAKNSSNTNIYIQSARLNGRPYTRSYLRHEDLVAGGRLVFEMGPEPNRAWGVGSGNVPVAEIREESILPTPYLVSGDARFRTSTKVALGSQVNGARIHYTLDGTEPTAASPAYEGPFEVDRTTVVKFRAVKDGLPPSLVSEVELRHRPQDWRLALATSYRPHYSAGGDGALVDGLRGTDDFRSGAWQGYEEVDLGGVVDLGHEQALRKVGAGFLQDVAWWIFLPPSVTFETSRDGTRFEPLGTVDADIPPDRWDRLTRDFTLDARGTRARYLRVTAKNIGRCPPGHPGAGGKAFLFTDEILIEAEP